jgi:hypothetical protein
MLPKTIAEICEIFDCQVITDISDPPGFNSEDNPRRPVRAFQELSALTLLNTSEPMEDDADWWVVRAQLLAYDCNKDKIPSLWQRRN